MATSLFPENKLYQRQPVSNGNKVAPNQSYIGVFSTEVFSMFSGVLRKGPVVSIEIR
jgi:hypothetical protein